MNNELPLVSVIVPVYNVERYIEQCARSIFEQTYPRLEIIFVNDCTPDGSIYLLKTLVTNYHARMSQSKIIDTGKNSGLTVARSIGIKKCTGDYVLCIDSDDYIEPCMVEQLTEIAITGNHDIVATPYFTNSNGSEKIIDMGDCDKFFCLNSMPIDTLHFSLWNKLINKSIIDQIPEIPNANCWEDLAMTSRAIALAKNPKAINVPLYHYRIGENANSLTSQPHEKRLHDQLTVARFVEQWFIDNNLDTKYAPFLRNMKFSAKIKFLRGPNRDFAAWKRTFPETNNGILHYCHIPLHYRLLFFMADILPTRLCQRISDAISKK